MKKLIALILVVFMTLTIVGCSDENANSSVNSESNHSDPTESLSNGNQSLNNSVTTPTNDTLKYETKVIEGQYFLVPIGNNISGNTNFGSGDTNFSEIAPCVSFESVDEFVNTLKKGNFTSDALKMVSRFEKDELGRVKICNPNKIYEPIAPNKFSLSGVTWDGETYWYGIRTSEECQVQFIVHTEESFESRAEFYWDHYGRGFEFDKSKKYPDYTEINYKTGIVDFKLKRYTLETDVSTYEKASTKTQMYVEEEYILRSEDSYFPTSSEIPYTIKVFVENDDLQYEMTIRDIKSPVTPEWLMQFGLKPVGQ